jgi:nitrogen fixation protein NifQ
MQREEIIGNEAIVSVPQHLSLDAQSIHGWLSVQSAGDVEDSHFFASVIAARYREQPEGLPLTLGMSGIAFLSLLNHCFPSTLKRPLKSSDFYIKPATPLVESMSSRDEVIKEEIKDIHDLLISHRATGRQQEEWIATILAATALRSNHLWEDLGLRNRGEVSRLIHRNFPRLAKENDANQMRWKKFFYRKLCESNGMKVCRSPNCQTCDEYHSCFSSEQSEHDRTSGVIWVA